MGRELHFPSSAVAYHSHADKGITRIDLIRENKATAWVLVYVPSQQLKKRFGQFWLKHYCPCLDFRHWRLPVKVDGVGTINPSSGALRSVFVVVIQKFLHAGSDNQRQAAAAITFGGYR